VRVGREVGGRVGVVGVGGLARRVKGSRVLEEDVVWCGEGRVASYAVRQSAFTERGCNAFITSLGSVGCVGVLLTQCVQTLWRGEIAFLASASGRVGS
jgi:hypothetical protein